MRFQIISESSESSLEREVNAALHLGWKLHGSPFVVQDTEVTCFSMCQAMILETEKANP